MTKMGVLQHPRLKHTDPAQIRKCTYMQNVPVSEMCINTKELEGMETVYCYREGHFVQK